MNQAKKDKISGTKNCLAKRFALYIFIILLIVNICSFFYIYTIEKKRTLRTVRHQGSVLGQYVGTTVYHHLLTYDYIALDEVLDKLMSLNELCYVAILASNEVYVAFKASSRSSDTLFDPATSASLVKDKAPLSMVKKMREQTLDHINVSIPIIFTDTYLGRVVVGLSMETSRKETREFLTMLLIVNALVAIILGGGIYIFFWKRALQPINKLIEGANRVAQGNLEVPIPIVCENELGQLTNAFNTMMTTRKQAEEKLQQKQQDWERLFNAVEDVVTIQDNNMYILQANAAAGSLLGKDPDELVGKHCYALFQKRTDPCPNCPVFLCRNDHAYHYADMDCLVMDKTFHVSAFPIFDKEQGWIGIAHIARDISDQVKMAAHYQQTQRMEAIGTLAGGIAHDFNNILTPIFGCAQLIKMEAEPGSNVDENIDVVLHSSTLAKELVQQILTFSRERQQGMQELRLQSVLKESMKLLRSSIPSTIAFRLAIAENCENIRADPTQLHQIIMNLCTNAYHAMEQSGGILAVTLQQVVLDSTTALLKGNLCPGEYLKLKISDTGIGMDAVTIARIFEPFFTTKEEGKGTGMGLAVVHGLVKEYGGTISVSSKIGFGTTFTIYLPVASAAKNLAGPVYQMDKEKAACGGNEHILVVDDEGNILALEQRILERRGYSVTTSIDGRQALELFKKTPYAFDLVITDMTMPGMTGLELAEQLIALRHDIPVILCSGHNRTAPKELLNNGLITHFIPKPINIWQLTDVVRETLDDSQGKTQKQ